jgi:hypothetical protein
VLQLDRREGFSLANTRDEDMKLQPTALFLESFCEAARSALLLRKGHLPKVEQTPEKSGIDLQFSPSFACDRGQIRLRHQQLDLVFMQVCGI